MAIVKPVCPTEAQEQKAFMQWVATQPAIRELILHIANEHAGNAISGRNRRLMGVRKGVSDIFLPLPTKSHHGLWIELKRKVGARESSEQRAWINLMRSLGYAAEFCYGCDHAIAVVLSYLATRS